MTHKVIQEYLAVGSKEISLTLGSCVTVLTTDEKGWAEGINDKGETGIFPLSVIESVTPELRTNISTVKKRERLTRRVSSRLKSVLRSDITTSNLELSLAKQRQDSIYGMALEDVFYTYGRPIPPLIKQCSRALQKHVEEEGIFRVSGMASDIKAIGEEFAEPFKVVDLSSRDCHAVSGAFKKFFRELPQPLIPTDIYDGLISASRESDATKIKQLLKTMPLESFLLLRFVIKFLYRVSKHSAKNMMAPDNLGIVFGPTLMRSKAEVETGIPNPVTSTAEAVALMIVNFKSVFRKDDEYRKRLQYSSSGLLSARTADTRKPPRAHTSISVSGSSLLIATPRSSRPKSGRHQSAASLFNQPSQ